MIDEKRFSKLSSKEISQNIILENRKKITVSGVCDVGSFDDEAVSLYTEEGMLSVKGEELKINKLSLEEGEVIIEGRIDAMQYSDEESKKDTSFLKKLFK